MEDRATITDSECLRKRQQQTEMTVGSRVSPGLATNEKGPRDLKVEP